MHSAMRSGGARLNLAKPGLVSDIRDAMTLPCPQVSRSPNALACQYHFVCPHHFIARERQNFLPDVDANAPLFLPQDARRFSAANSS